MLPRQKAWVPSLVRELRSCMLLSIAKRKKELYETLNIFVPFEVLFLYFINFRTKNANRKNKFYYRFAFVTYFHQHFKGKVIRNPIQKERGAEEIIQMSINMPVGYND